MWTRALFGCFKGNKKDGGNVQVWSNNTESAQKWVIEQNGDGSYRIIAKCSGLSLNIDACNIEKNTNVQQWSANDSIAQKWLLIPYDDDTYYVASEDIKEWVYLRSKPSKDESTILMIVPKWHTVTYTGEITGDYMGVKYRNKTGYIYSKYLKRFDRCVGPWQYFYRRDSLCDPISQDRKLPDQLHPAFPE